MMQPNVNTEIKETYLGFYRHKPITWSAVISGALIAFGLTFLLNLLLIGIGLAVYTTSTQGEENLALYGFIITLVGGFILLFIAGWKTGKLIKYCPKYPVTKGDPTLLVEHKHCGCYHGMTHGFLAWVVYLILSLMFFSAIAQSASLSFMKSSYLVSQTLDNQTQRKTGIENSASADRQVNKTLSIPPVLAQKVSVQIIATFLILLFGAVGCSLGSYFAVLSRKKYYTHKE